MTPDDPNLWSSPEAGGIASGWTTGTDVPHVYGNIFDDYEPEVLSLEAAYGAPVRRQCTQLGDDTPEMDR